MKRSRAGWAVAAALAVNGCGEVHAPDPAKAVARAYASVPTADRTALRLGHLKGYFLIAARQSEPAAAAALASQGMLEVYDGQPGGFTALGLDETTLRAAAARGSPTDIKAALTSLNAAQARAGGSPAAVASALAGLAAGLYDSALNGGGVDGLEYQHSLGMALAAQDLIGDDPRRSKAASDLKDMLASWPGPAVPEHPTPVARIDAQAAQVRADLA